MHTQSFQKINRWCHSPCSQNVPFQPGWQTHTPARHWPCPEQSGTWQSCSGMSHSGPFQPSSQWHSPPPYFPWLEHKTGQTPGPITKIIQTNRYKHNSFSLLAYHICVFGPSYHICLYHSSSSSSSNNRQQTMVWPCTKISWNMSWMCKVTILWIHQVWTNRFIPINKPDIIHDNKKATCVLMEVAIPRDRSVIMKEAEKILKC